MDDEEKLQRLEKQFERLGYSKIEELLKSFGISMTDTLKEMGKQHIFAIIQNDYSTEEIEKEMSKIN